MKLANTYCLNKGYKFKNDIRRILLINNFSRLCTEKESSTPFQRSLSSIIHPYIAFFFSFFDGHQSLNDTLASISEEFEIPKNEVERIIFPLINNEEPIKFTLSEGVSAVLPINFLEEGRRERDLIGSIDLDEIIENIDIVTVRNYLPDWMTIMINDKCLTNCVYCYADTGGLENTELEIEKLKAIIDEAYEMDCNDVGILGGDIFLYHRWFELVEYLNSKNYAPILSTKKPIRADEIAKLKSLVYRKLQISLDTVCNQEVESLLGVPGTYLDKMMDTLNVLNEQKIKFSINTILTKYNCEIVNLKKLIRTFLNFEYLEELVIASSEKSFYKGDHFLLSEDQIFQIMAEDFTKDPRVKWSLKKLKEGANIKEDGSTKVGCPGNVKSLNILPDGAVTICEQMFWNRNFILGNVYKDSIKGIWCSERATAKWDIEQRQIQRLSPCSRCPEFNECRKEKGICWAEIVKEFGANNSDFPYPGCVYGLL